MKKFKLAGCLWDVVETDMPDLGATNPDACKILINKRLTGQDCAVTFYHELVHAYMLRLYYSGDKLSQLRQWGEGDLVGSTK